MAFRAGKVIGTFEKWAAEVITQLSEGSHPLLIHNKETGKNMVKIASLFIFTIMIQICHKLKFSNEYISKFNGFKLWQSFTEINKSSILLLNNLMHLFQKSMCIANNGCCLINGTWPCYLKQFFFHSNTGWSFIFKYNHEKLVSKRKIFSGYVTALLFHSHATCYTVHRL